ncbi:MAG: hypothetical protein C0394_02215 [Syntrophus sp. (in: bacteria)]|nr:hypothetical protein [Syntrophus sp. (in: bacteria)]
MLLAKWGALYDDSTAKSMSGEPCADEFMVHLLQRMYGWSEAEALKMNIRELISEKQRPEALDMVQRLARAEILEPYRAQRLAKDGRIVEVWLTATALINDTGETYAIATTERGAMKGD